MSNKVAYKLNLTLDHTDVALDEINTQVGEDITISVKLTEDGVLKTVYTGLTADIVAVIKDKDGINHKYSQTGITITAADGEFTITPATTTAKLTDTAGRGTGEIYLKDSNGETTISNSFKIFVAPTAADYQVS